MAARDQARRLSDCCPQEGRTGEALQPRPGSASSSLSTWRATARSYFGTGHHEDRTQTTAMPQPRKPPCGRLPRAGGGNDVSGHALNLPSTGRAGRRLLGRASARGGRTTPPNRASVSPEPISRAFGRFVLLPTLEGVTSAPAQVGAFYSRGKRCQPNELEAANADPGQRQTCEN